MIEYFHSKGVKANEIKADFDSTFDESAASKSMIKRWITEFKMGRTSTEDEPRSGRPSRGNYPGNGG